MDVTSGPGSGPGPPDKEKIESILEKYFLTTPTKNLALLFYAVYCIRPTLVNGLQLNYVEDSSKNLSQPVRKPEDFLIFYQGVEGTPGVDFPVYSHIPKTAFSCKGVESGYYADLDTECQVFHICEEEKKISFLCPNGTIFQQSDLICEWWFKVNCSNSPNLYEESAEQLREHLARRKLLRRVYINGKETKHGAIMRMEEAASVSVQKNGKNYEVQSQEYHNDFKKPTVPQHEIINNNNNRKTSGQYHVYQKHNLDQNRAERNSRILIKSAINQIVNNEEKNAPRINSVNHSKSRRFNDAQTGNRLNNYYNHENYGQKNDKTITEHYQSTIRTSISSDSFKEYHVQFSATSPEVDYSENRATNAYTITVSPLSRRKVLFGNNQSVNRDGRKYNNNLESGHIETNSRNTQDEITKSYSSESHNHRPEFTTFSNSNSNDNYSYDDGSRTPPPGKASSRSSNARPKNPIINKKIEAMESDESQITQESSAFVGSSFNSIQENLPKYLTSNPHPNHQTTYSDLKQPNFKNTKFSTTISSVTPQYVTTQPINNGKPFLGSRVGSNIHTTIGTIFTQPIHLLTSSTPTSNTYVSVNGFTKSYETTAKPNITQSTVKPISTTIVTDTAYSDSFDQLGVKINVKQKAFNYTSHPNSELNKSISLNKFGESSLNTENIQKAALENKKSAKVLLGNVRNNIPNNNKFEVTANPLSIEYTSPNYIHITAQNKSAVANSNVIIKPIVSTLNIGSTDETLPPNLGFSTVRNEILTDQFTVGSTDKTITPTSDYSTVNNAIPTEKFNIGNIEIFNLGNTDKTLLPITEYSTEKNYLFNFGQTNTNFQPATKPTGIELSTTSTVNFPNHNENTFNLGVKVNPAITTALPLRSHSSSTFHPFLVTTTLLPDEATSKRTVDHATVYGIFSKNTPTVPTSLIRNVNQGVSINYDKYVNKVGVNLNKTIGSAYSQRPLLGIAQKTKSPNELPKYGSTVSPPLLRINTFVRLSDIQTTVQPVTTDIPEKINSSRSSYLPITFKGKNTFGSSVQPPLVEINANIHLKDIQNIKKNTPGSGFFVTKNSVYDFSTIPSNINKPVFSYSDETPFAVNIGPNSYFTPDATTQYPRPFKKSLYPGFSPTTEHGYVPITSALQTYKISSARPFKAKEENNLYTLKPTVPTHFTTAIPSIYENVDNMISVLMKLANAEEQDYSSETPRPGLVIPPSAGTQSLHTLAVYFANALDGIRSEKERLIKGEMNEEEKEKLTSLLTQMTVHGYNRLFRQKGEETETESTTVSSDIIDEQENELEEQSSGNVFQTLNIRQLAKNFTLALSSYLNDPEMFKKGLEDLRPTEPPPLNDDKRKDNLVDIGTGDEELLNFSDTDSKSSFSPIFPTVPSVSPTWGFILATKEPNDSDVKKSLNPDLNTADSQSFVPSYNNLNAAKYTKESDKDKVTKGLPENHWTTSPSATKLWQSAFLINPAILNENFENTIVLPTNSDIREIETDFTAPDDTSVTDKPHGEFQYELRTLPKLALNSTQIHGILINFMNTTSDDSKRFHRILKKMNTSEEEFLNKIKEIETNSLTKRLILLLISECGINAAKDIKSLNSNNDNKEILEHASSNSAVAAEIERKPNVKSNSPITELVYTSVIEDDQDARALQLLNSLYSIASKFGK